MVTAIKTRKGTLGIRAKKPKQNVYKIADMPKAFSLSFSFEANLLAMNPPIIPKNKPVIPT